MREVKPGDICMVTQGVNRNRLAISLGSPTRAIAYVVFGLEAWEIELLQPFDDIRSIGGELTRMPAGSRIATRKSILRPIGDDEGDDETLSWAGKPSELKELLTDPLWKTLERL
jgi:hypothetical protein